MRSIRASMLGYLLCVHESMDHAIEKGNKLEPSGLAQNCSPHDEDDTGVMVYLEKTRVLPFQYQDPVKSSMRQRETKR